MRYRQSYPVISLLLLLLAITVLACISIGSGSMKLTAGEIIGAAFGKAEQGTVFIVRKVRLPRILNALLVGMCLASSGLLFQRLLHNPLASPDIIGIQNGASFAAVLVLTTSIPVQFLAPGAFIGSVSTAAVIYLLSWKKGIQVSRLILIGIGLNALSAAGTQFLMIRGKIQTASRAYHWITGSLYSTDMKDAALMILSLSIFFIMLYFLIPALRGMQLGDSGASSIGIRVETHRLLLLGLAAMLSATAVSVGGPIGFVALMVPHFIRSIYSKISIITFLLSACAGGLLVLAADFTAQHIFPIDIPAGLVITVIGAPYFLMVLYKKRFL